MPRAAVEPACCAASDARQAFVEPPSTEHHVGKIVLADLVTPDLASFKRFYGGIFGMNFRNRRTGDATYAVASRGGSPVAGMIEQSIDSGEHHLRSRSAAGAKVARGMLLPRYLFSPVPSCMYI